MRYFHLYEQLSRFYDITLLSPTYQHHPAEQVRFSDSFREYRVPKEDVHARLHHDLERQGIGPECSALVCSLASEEERGYRKRYRQLVSVADAVVHESPYMMPYDEFFGQDGKPRIYNSHNVESELVESMFQGPQRERWIDHVSDLENALVAGAALILATCADEREKFHAIYACPQERLALAPNGFEPKTIAPSRPGEVKTSLGFAPERALVGFIGSAHPPNLKAAQFIVDTLAPRLLQVDFVIMGAVCSRFTSRRGNVHLMGIVSSEDKDRVLAACDVVVNPMFSGAGTNLKTIEFLALGLPLVATSCGVRGIEVEDGTHCLVAERDQFVDALDALLADSGRRERLAQAARKLAYDHYTWRAIGERVRDELDAVFERSCAPRPRSRRSVLVLNDYPVSSTVGGGATRISRLLRGLARNHEVTLLCLSDLPASTEQTIGPGFREISIPKVQEQLNAQVDLIGKSPVAVNDFLSAAWCNRNEAYLAAYREFAAQADLVVLEHPYMAPVLARDGARVPVVYSSQNHETAMKSELLRSHPHRDLLMEALRKIEALAIARASLLVCVSEEDLAQFAAGAELPQHAVIRNGCDVFVGKPGRDLSRVKEIFGGRPVAAFIGSAHPPNLEAARFIASELAPQLPEVVFMIIGSAGNALAARPTPGNVLLLGVVEDEERDVLLAVADIGLNPMTSGGGSNLKLGEYFANSLPTVSTPFGARGFEVQHGTHLLVGDPNEFAGHIRALLADEALGRRLARNAYAYALQELDWNVLAERYRDALEPIMRRRLLVVTYRYTVPPLGGAEEYLHQVLTWLSRTGAFTIDVATVAVSGVTNVLHFVSQWSELHDPLDQPVHVRAVRRFKADPLAHSAALAGSRLLQRRWVEEDLRQARDFGRLYGDAAGLLGGWHGPERHNGPVQRWTAPTCELYGGGAEWVVVAGYAPGRQTVRAQLGGVCLAELGVAGGFKITVPLPAGKERVLTLTVEPVHAAPEDPRPLGVMVHEVAWGGRGQRRTIDLGRGWADVAREQDFDGWMASTIEAAEARDPEHDATFLRLRGPQSEELAGWLETHTADYDVVLAHGVPFASACMGVEAAARAGVPSAALPHFHYDDRFYHWRCYYEAFRRADTVFTSPDSAKARFFDRIGANALTVPGGGVEPKEFADLGPRLEAFRRMHPSGVPFVLVLGRKDGGKNYRQVIEAVRRVRGGGLNLEVVMIGPDHDGVPIAESFVHTCGPKPREVVLGALAACLCLANASTSESFGIVILEAWMAGRPVVANATCPAFRDLVQHGEDGFLYVDEETLAERLAFLIQHPAQAEAMGRKGRERALKYFTWSRIAGIVAQELHRIIDTRPAAGQRSRPWAGDAEPVQPNVARGPGIGEQTI